MYIYIYIYIHTYIHTYMDITAWVRYYIIGQMLLHSQFLRHEHIIALSVKSYYITRQQEYYING